MKCGPAAKKSTAWATSSTLPLHCIGVLRAKCAACDGSLSSSAIHPGATQLTLTSGAKALAIACVSECSAAFDAQ